MKILITGNTGFKGSWLTAMLISRGHHVYGLSNSIPKGGFFSTVGVANYLIKNFHGDIRNKQFVEETISETRPDIVIHLAAQSLVRKSYEDPFETFEINSQGTLNVLNAIRKRAPEAYFLAITTDKVYANTGKIGGYVEDDPLGVADPYSSSKAMADIALQSWASSFTEGMRIAIARAGNVIGPLDVSEDRLIPDAERAITSDRNILIRFPEATRPWQYVLDCLSGYIRLIELREKHWQGAWNFGPLPTHEKSVIEVIEEVQKITNLEVTLDQTIREGKPEHALLTLDSSKARRSLEWSDKVSFQDAVMFSIKFGSELRKLDQDNAWTAALDHIEFHQNL